jgi:GTP-binding protein
MKPLVAIVGRPNVGKSTLYNRIAGGRPAMVEDKPGVTRDRRYGEADYAGRSFRIVDTGGLDPGAEEGALQEGVHHQARKALAEADVIVFVVDARDGITATDRDVAGMLRRLKKPILVVANKVDSAKQESLANEIWEIGLGDVFGVSATHGRGMVEFLDALLAVLGPEPEPTPAAQPAVRIAFVGRPNVGKSSLVNRLLGEDRVLVHDEPGTTTDPVDTPFEVAGNRYVLVDTAGIRRKARIDEPTEKIAVSMALGQLERTDVAILVIDAASGVVEQDAKIAGAIEDAGRAAVIALNKSDLMDDKSEKRLRREIADTMPFVAFAPIRFCSAKTGAGVVDLIAAASKAYEQHGKRIPTGELNRFFQEVCETTPPPTFRSKPVRIYYISQPAVHPPTFVLWANRPELVHHAYRRFLMNQLRERFGFEGTPLRVITRRRNKD